MTGPLCQLCGATRNVEFSLLPQVPGYRFGQICVPCEEAAQEEGTE